MPEKQKQRLLLSVEDLSASQAKQLIQVAQKLKRGEIGASEKKSEKNPAKIVILAFFEPSTRTALSFEIAALRLGLKPVNFAAAGSTSLAKGESLHETLVTLISMKPDLLVVRHSGDAKIEEQLAISEVPVINAGSGTKEHPTQALLDAMTVFERRDKIEGERILYVGDIEHSRVARSGNKLFSRLGAAVAVCAPKELMPSTSDWAQATRFEKLSDALKWSTVCIGLRLQKERHSKKPYAFNIEEYRLDKKNLSSLATDAVVMHPGPFIAELDVSEEILDDPRCAIHDQVTNGVYMRMAVIGEMLGLSYS
ncbi:MAG: aspartate carbamoyltransferase [Bdellovibrionales bacterium RBG_16_40_8]|nr:MAG: aspartate carbamoyltransferase [Bdellovibrionales bacterium RBG_16_40_8]